MKKILSTKILSPSQKATLNNMGIDLVEYNAIRIEFLDFEFDETYDNHIFTSQNAVRSFLRKCDELPLPEKRAEARKKESFCVGEKTKALLEENGRKVVKIAENSLELAQFIVKNHKNDSFLFFCGNRRREDLPAILKENTVRFKEVIIYRTNSNPQNFEQHFNGVLFFSPSGVESFNTMNNLEHTTAFCIGNTTAGEAAKHTNSISISKKQTVESVIEQVVKTYNPSIEH